MRPGPREKNLWHTSCVSPCACRMRLQVQAMQSVQAGQGLKRTLRLSSSSSEALSSSTSSSSSNRLDRLVGP